MHKNLLLILSIVLLGGCTSQKSIVATEKKEIPVVPKKDSINILKAPHKFSYHKIDSFVKIDNPYIRFNQNKIEFPAGESPNFTHFANQYRTLLKNKDRQLFIYHIGGSHIQADLYTHKVREHLDTLRGSTQAPRGLIFPFATLGYSYPFNYKVEYTGKWEGRRASQNHKEKMGLLGFYASTEDSLVRIKIFKNQNSIKTLQHNQVRLFSNLHSNHKIEFPNRNITETTINTQKNYQEFRFQKQNDTLLFNVHTNGKKFTIYGLELMNNNPGIIYNTIGINGASFTTYESCENFEIELSARTPDLFVISIGTNDANVSKGNFDKQQYYQKYKNMIDLVLKIQPKCAILLTVPNDAWYKKKYPNPNVQLTQEVIYKLAKEYKLGVWNLYNIMGGFNSSSKWLENGFMHSDKVHFSLEGYKLKADLFIVALEKYMVDYKIVMPNE